MQYTTLLKVIEKRVPEAKNRQFEAKFGKDRS